MASLDYSSHAGSPPFVLSALLAAENCNVFGRITIKYLHSFHDPTVVSVKLGEERTDCAVIQILIKAEPVAVLNHPLQQVIIWTLIKSHHQFHVLTPF